MSTSEKRDCNIEKDTRKLKEIADLWTDGINHIFKIQKYSDVYEIIR